MVEILSENEFHKFNSSIHMATLEIYMLIMHSVLSSVLYLILIASSKSELLFESIVNIFSVVRSCILGFFSIIVEIYSSAVFCLRTSIVFFVKSCIEAYKLLQ